MAAINHPPIEVYCTIGYYLFNSLPFFLPPTLIPSPSAAHLQFTVQLVSGGWRPTTCHQCRCRDCRRPFCDLMLQSTYHFDYMYYDYPIISSAICFPPDHILCCDMVNGWVVQAMNLYQLDLKLFFSFLAWPLHVMWLMKTLGTFKILIFYFKHHKMTAMPKLKVCPKSFP